MRLQLYAAIAVFLSTAVVAEQGIHFDVEPGDSLKTIAAR
jgi:hypothetical protein